MQRYIVREGIFLIIFLFNSDYIYLSCLQTERKSADSVVLNANVITIDANNPRTEAFAVLLWKNLYGLNNIGDVSIDR